MTENKKKITTLGLSSTKLGLKTGEKLSISTPNVKQSAASGAGKGKVVVVTKGGKSTARSGAVGSSDRAGSVGGLTQSEREKRLRAIKEAELAKKKYEELSQEAKGQAQAAPAQEQQQSEEIREDIVAIQSAEISKTQESSSNEEAVASENIEAPISRISLDSLMRKGKVKNLNSMYRPPRPAKQEESTIAPPATDLTSGNSKKVNAKDKKDFSYGKKQQNYDDLDTAEPHKPIGNDSDKKISVSQVMMMYGSGEESGNVGMRRRSLASIRRAREKAKRKMLGEKKIAEKVLREVSIPDFITVQELSSRMAEKTSDVIKALMKLGMMVTVNQSIDADTAELVIGEFGHKVKRVTEAEIESNLLQKIEDVEESLRPRPPVVTIMGHVDHGKTSLLDALRNTDVAAGEAGGITQHIGAYQVRLENDKVITFLDTPGHEAFTAMRMRGAQVTDIVVLVVAADDGIMQQTVEAISHAKAAQVPIIVAINKIDKPGANPEKVKGELFVHGIIPEDMGGDTMIVEVSAKQKINLDKLEEAILLQADFLELKANPDRLSEGAVIESKVDKGRGILATLLVQKGTLNIGDIVVAGTSWGKIRALVNDKGHSVTSANPSTPIEIQGLEQAPTAGDEFTVVANEKAARDLVSFRIERDRQRKLVASKPSSLDVLFRKVGQNGIKELPVIIKADVHGSAEAIATSLQKLSTDEIAVKILYNGVGGITESDVTLASASQAIILAFNVRATNQARDLAKTNGIDIKYYSIIYNLVDDIKAAMGGMLSPVTREELLGYADVRQVFDLTKFGKVAGCYVTEGSIKRNANARIIRDNVVIFDGKLKALKRFKEDVREVNAGFECGLSFENYEDIKAGDKIEAYELISEARTL